MLLTSSYPHRGRIHSCMSHPSWGIQASYPNKISLHSSTCCKSNPLFRSCGGGVLGGMALNFVTPYTVTCKAIWPELGSNSANELSEFHCTCSECHIAPVVWIDLVAATSSAFWWRPFNHVRVGGSYTAAAISRATYMYAPCMLTWRSTNSQCNYLGTLLWLEPHSFLRLLTMTRSKLVETLTDSAVLQIITVL